MLVLFVFLVFTVVVMPSLPASIVLALDEALVRPVSRVVLPSFLDTSVARLDPANFRAGRALPAALDPDPVVALPVPCAVDPDVTRARGFGPPFNADVRRRDMHMMNFEVRNRDVDVGTERRRDE